MEFFIAAGANSLMSYRVNNGIIEYWSLLEEWCLSGLTQHPSKHPDFTGNIPVCLIQLLTDGNAYENR